MDPPDWDLLRRQSCCDGEYNLQASLQGSLRWSRRSLQIQGVFHQTMAAQATQCHPHKIFPGCRAGMMRFVWR